MGKPGVKRVKNREPASIDARLSKPLLSSTQLVEHLKRRGVTFDLISEASAARYLDNDCYFFKLSAYRKLFDRHEGGAHDGQYVNLDFGHLVALAGLDQQLRETLLPMSLDIEHFHKTNLLRQAVTHENGDGRSIVEDYFASLDFSYRKMREGEIERASANPYTANVFNHYATCLPVQAFFELASFGTLIDFMRFCADRWHDRELRDLHYGLKSVKSIRNATARSSCLINKIFSVRSSLGLSQANSAVLSALGVPKRRSTKWIASRRISEITRLLILYSKLIPNGQSRSKSQVRLNRLFSVLDLQSKILGPNNRGVAAMGFIRDLTQLLGLV